MHDNDTPSVELYYRSSCSYCQKVLDYINRHQLNVELHLLDRDQWADDRLRALGGKAQVPLLVVADTPLYESDDIIDWLKHNLVETRSCSRADVPSPMRST